MAFGVPLSIIVAFTIALLNCALVKRAKRRVVFEEVLARTDRDPEGGGGGGVEGGGGGGGGGDYTSVTLHCHHQNESCIKMGSYGSHFIVSLIVRASHKTVSTDHNFGRERRVET